MLVSDEILVYGKWGVKIDREVTEVLREKNVIKNGSFLETLEKPMNRIYS
jgi:hypothetical protein